MSTLCPPCVFSCKKQAKAERGEVYLFAAGQKHQNLALQMVFNKWVDKVCFVLKITDDITLKQKMLWIDLRQLQDTLQTI